MLAGHYAPALALKALRVPVPLWALLVSVQLVDIAWSIFVVTGVEEAHIEAGFTASNGLVLEDVAISHSLVAALAWGAGAGLLAAAWLRRPAAAVAVGVAVASHWLLDLPMHVADLPFFASDGPRFGFGLWNHRAASCALELGLLALAGAAYVRVWGWGRRQAILGLVLLIVGVAAYYGPQPEGIVATALSGLALYVLVPMLARGAG